MHRCYTECMNNKQLIESIQDIARKEKEHFIETFGALKKAERWLIPAEEWVYSAFAHKMEKEFIKKISKEWKLDYYNHWYKESMNRSIDSALCCIGNIDPEAEKKVKKALRRFNAKAVIKRLAYDYDDNFEKFLEMMTDV